MKPSKDLDEILADKSGAVSDNQKQAILQWVSETVVGHDKPSNYQTLCDPCHQFKSKIENQLKPFMNKGESNERTSR